MPNKKKRKTNGNHLLFLILYSWGDDFFHAIEFDELIGASNASTE
jgi:hypothetical protein